MKESSRLSTPLLLIIIGVWYLLTNLGFIPITPWQGFMRYWPSILIWYGIKNLVKELRNKNHPLYVSPFAIIFWLSMAAIGMYNLLPRLGFVVVPISWNLVWPVIVILIGISYFFKDQFLTRVFHGKSSWSDKSHSYNSIIGDFSRGGNGWVVEDTNLTFGIGDVKFDLTQAIIPERHININVSGLIGDIVIYLPEDLPFKTNCYAKLGEVSVLQENRSGVGNLISLETPDYSTATRKLDIQVQLKIGEVKIRRIG